MHLPPAPPLSPRGQRWPVLGDQHQELTRSAAARWNFIGTDFYPEPWKAGCRLCHSELEPLRDQDLIRHKQMGTLVPALPCWRTGRGESEHWHQSPRQAPSGAGHTSTWGWFCPVPNMRPQKTPKPGKPSGARAKPQGQTSVSFGTGHRLARTPTPP